MVLLAALAGVAVAGALLVPVAAADRCGSSIVRAARDGLCKANSPYPRGTTAKRKDGTYSYSAHARGTCSRHHGVKHWYR